MGARGSKGVSVVRVSVLQTRAKFGLAGSILEFWPKFGPVLVLEGCGPTKLGGTRHLWAHIAHAAQKVPCGFPILRFG